MRHNAMGHALAAALALGIALTGCQQATGTQKGAAGGAALGAGVGYLLGDSGAAAAAGAVVGGLLGGVMGRQHDQISGLKQEQAQRDSTRVVNVRNSNGSMTPVVMRLVGVDQWRGPRGEIYNGLPSPSQLKPIYGI